MNTFKICLIGKASVGKSTYLNRLLNGHFTSNYDATLGVDVHPLRFQTNYGPICFNVWDTAGQEKFSGLGDGYYIGANAAIFMFDVTSKFTFTSIPGLFTNFDRMIENVPRVIVGNKVDRSDERKVTYEEIGNLREKLLNVAYYDISAKSNYNFDKPFLYLARELMNRPDLVFLDEFNELPNDLPKAKL